MEIVTMLTTGSLFHHLDDARNMKYRELASKIFAELDADKGFLGQSGTESDSSWGRWTVPECYQKEEYTGRTIQTLSLWRDLESMVAYSYHGIHAQALKRRDEWFPKISLPNHAIWWIDNEHQPTWAEAAAQYDRIVNNGTSAEAFNMKDLYDANGESVKLNQTKLTEMAKRYTRTK